MTAVLVVHRDQLADGYMELIGRTDHGHPIVCRRDYELIGETPEGHYLVLDPGAHA